MSTRRTAGERGSIAVEVAVIAPAFLVFMLLIVYAGRIAQAEADVRSAAAEAARAASLEATAEAATEAGRTVATNNLATSGVACADLAVDVDTTLFGTGGQVAVTVRCTASLADLALLRIPVSHPFEARSVEVIDRYRGGA